MRCKWTDGRERASQESCKNVTIVHQEENLWISPMNVFLELAYERHSDLNSDDVEAQE